MIAGMKLHIDVDGSEVTRCPRLVLRSIRHTPLSMADIHVPDPDGSAARMLLPGAPVTITYGYRGGDFASWTGTIQGSSRVKRDQICLHANGKDLPLVTSCVRECYADESSIAIAGHLLGHTGLPVAKVDIPNESIPHFPVSSLPVWEAVRQLMHTLQRSFGHYMRRSALWLGTDGLYLGDLDEAGNIPVVETGQNLIKHSPATLKDGFHVVETFLLPGMSHSRLFELKDSRLNVTQQYRALEVRHVLEPKRMRTFLHYGREHAWC